jgi:hypothetical protein
MLGSIYIQLHHLYGASSCGHTPATNGAPDGGASAPFSNCSSETGSFNSQESASAAAVPTPVLRPAASSKRMPSGIFNNHSADAPICCANSYIGLEKFPLISMYYIISFYLPRASITG